MHRRIMRIPPVPPAEFVSACVRVSKYKILKSRILQEQRVHVTPNSNNRTKNLQLSELADSTEILVCVLHTRT